MPAYAARCGFRGSRTPAPPCAELGGGIEVARVHPDSKRLAAHSGSVATRSVAADVGKGTDMAKKPVCSKCGHDRKVVPTNALPTRDGQVVWELWMCSVHFDSR